jgi:hypothetical protein
MKVIFVGGFFFARCAFLSSSAANEEQKGFPRDEPGAGRRDREKRSVKKGDERE